MQENLVLMRMPHGRAAVKIVFERVVERHCRRKSVCGVSFSYNSITLSKRKLVEMPSESTTSEQQSESIPPSTLAAEVEKM